MKDVKFAKVTCSKCGTLNLIPVVNGVFAIDDIVKCEACGKVIAQRE